MITQIICISILWSILGIFLVVGIDKLVNDPKINEDRLRGIFQAVLVFLAGPLVWIAGICFGIKAACKHATTKRILKQIFFKPKFHDPPPIIPPKKLEELPVRNIRVNKASTTRFKSSIFRSNKE